MKITDVRATKVAVPVRHPAVKLWFQRTHVTRTIVEVETDAGITGVGETRGRWSATLINQEMRPRLVGVDPLDRAAAQALCVEPCDDFGFPEQTVDRIAFAGVEVALWDIAGKQAGLPLYDLLGGKVRAAAPFAAYGYPIDPESGIARADIPRSLARRAAEIVAEQGAKVFEFKIARHDLDTDIATILAVREALGPDVHIAVDANMGFSVDQARTLLRKVEPARLDNFEEPVADLAAMAGLRQEFGVPVSTHCVLLDAIKPYPSIDAVATDPPLHGGIAGTVAIMRAVAETGRGFWLRSTWELGVSWAVMCHMGVACREITRAAQGLIDRVADDLILGAPWLVRGGGVPPPPRPGLGVDLDRAALRRFAVDAV